MDVRPREKQGDEIYLVDNLPDASTFDYEYYILIRIGDIIIVFY